MPVLGPDGRYELRDPIGGSSRSTVYHAADLRRRAPVVIKRLDPAWVLPAAVARYVDHVAALRDHPVPAIVLPLEIVTQDPGPYVVSPALEGQSLEAALRGGPLGWSRAVAIVAAIAGALAAVAAVTDRTHRALKPSNLWLLPDGEVRVLDHGGAVLGASAPVYRGDTWFEYRAPEQVGGAEGDARSDVFTLAVLLLELTTGVHPFAGPNAQFAAQKLAKTPPDLAELTRGMSPEGAREVTNLMTWALAGDPDGRPNDVAGFAALLDHARPAADIPAAPPPTPAPPAADPPTEALPLQRLPPTPTAEPPAPAAPPAPVAATPRPAPAPAQAPPLLAAPAPASAPAPSSASSAARSSPHPAVAARAAGPRAPSRQQPAPQDDPPTLAGKAVAPREEHTVVDRPPPAAMPAPADRTVVDYALPKAAPRPRPADRPEQTEILKTPFAEDDEDDRPTVAVRRGDATLMLADLPDSPASEAPAPAPDKPAGPSAQMQWTLVAVNVVCVVLVLAAVAYLFLR